MKDYEKPTVRLTGEDDNAFAVMGRVIRELRKAGADKEVIASYQADAVSGDYDHVLQVTMEYANVE